MNSDREAWRGRFRMNGIGWQNDVRKGTARATASKYLLTWPTCIFHSLTPTLYFKKYKKENCEKIYIQLQHYNIYLVLLFLKIHNQIKNLFHALQILYYFKTI